MSFIIKNANIFKDKFETADFHVSHCNGISVSSPDNPRVFEFNNCIVIPGLVDVHVHLREPGFSYKETIASGTRAAAHGGYTAVCPMPNLSPVPDCMESLKPELEAIERDAVIKVIPYGAITKGQLGKELADMEGMANSVIAFSDDGHGVQDDDVMRRAMKTAKKLGKLIVAHCEDNSLLNDGYIHDGKYARLHNHRGICSESEWRQIERDLALVRETGCSYHVCHVSAKESVNLIRRAKKEGLDVSCETSPHYLVFNDMDLQEDGRFKMNPPIRGEEDRLALIEGLCDGTIDMIATDHAPHSADEKSKGLAGSSMGVVGLETAFPVLYTKLVKPGIIPLHKLIELMNINPCRRFGIRQVEDYAVFDLDAEYTIDPSDFLSTGKNSPFAGMAVCGRTLITIYDSNVVWIDDIFKQEEEKWQKGQI